MATAAAGSDRLGDILIKEGLITREQLAQALAEQRASKHRLGYVLVKLGLVQELEITKLLARQYRMPAVDLSRFEVDPKLVKLIPGRSRDQARGAAAQARGPHADGRDGRSDRPWPARGPQVHHPVRPVPGHRGRVHAARADREALRERRTSSSRTSSRTWRGSAEDVEVVEERGGGDRRRGNSRRRAGRQADQRAPHRRGEARRERHSHRAVRARDPGALSRRRRAARGDEAAAQDEGGAHLAASRSCRSSTSPSGGCRRTAASS